MSKINIYVLLEFENGKFKPQNHAVLNAAKQLIETLSLKDKSAGIENHSLRALLIGENLENCADFSYAAQLPVEKLILIDHPIYRHFLAEPYAEAIVTALKSSTDFSPNTYLLAANSSMGKSLLPRVAALLEASVSSEVIAIKGPRVFQRLIYAGNVIETIEVSSAYPVCMTVRVTKFKSSAIALGQAGLIEKLAFVSNNDRSEWVKADQRPPDKPSLADAACVISGGRGLSDPGMFKRLMAIADRMGAAQGASRAAVDAGLAPNDCQVGQTGQIVAPKLYFAVGISGAIQHVAGIKDSQLIVAINKDPDAPIFQVADYGLVADINEVLEEWEVTLTELGY